MIRPALLSLAALLVAACSTLPEPRQEAGVEQAWRARRVALAGLADWTATGRILVQAEEEAWNATLIWRQRGEAYRIRLMAPLGQGTVQIAGDADGVTLRTVDDETFSATDPEALLLDTLGWQVPLRGLRHWLTGVDAPGISATDLRLDPLGRPEGLAQSGWTVRYLRYAGDAPLDLPAKIFLDRDHLAVRIVVNRWEAP